MKERLHGFAIIGALFIFAGGILTFKSVSFGTSMAESWLVSQGGADSGHYQIVITSYINTFLVAGGVMLGFGLLLTTLITYKLIKPNEETKHG
ncbi:MULTISPECIES: hypothetical protein [Mesobacillus]|uniref:Uncharacterized protein n=2 Tax=Mesobacillus TaxID=2675231 RepID=A0A0D6Z6V3_9BACI|nr:MULTISPECIES: hypothetical protein [Mesobacillus]KIY21040.1 hypothetical protein UB32_15875 [Mesobacillus subterraneus]MDQ0415414.1 hypothetical protein [Mesobacillus stamsii]